VHDLADGEIEQVAWLGRPAGRHTHGTMLRDRLPGRSFGSLALAALPERAYLDRASFWLKGRPCTS
jgi:hypothetical protein